MGCSKTRITINSIAITKPIPVKILPKRLLLNHSLLKVWKKVVNIGISVCPLTHLRTTVNIATVAGKKPKINKPIIEKDIHNKFTIDNLMTHSQALKMGVFIKFKAIHSSKEIITIISIPNIKNNISFLHIVSQFFGAN